MPTRNAFIRYRVINSYLKTHGSATLDELIEACEDALEIHPIGRRTIEGDLHAMRYDQGLRFNAPIVYDRSDRAYRYERDDFSIDGVPLDEEELHAIKFAATILEQYQHISYLEEFQGAVRKIIDTINVYRMREDEELDFIELERSPLVRGTEHLETLIRHIRERNVVRIEYRKFMVEEPEVYQVHPHLLKEYRDRWYLVAYHDEREDFRIFGLERIEQIDPVYTRTYLRKRINFEEFFRNSIGITKTNEEPSDIVVAFSRQQAKYIATQPVHDTQMLLKEENGRLHFQFHIVPTFEFDSMLLGWGSEVEVISPDWYRTKLVNLMKDALGQYGKR